MTMLARLHGILLQSDESPRCPGAKHEGGDDHNQTLSEKRAGAVLDYLVAHGIAKERLVSKGFASSEPADTNETVAGRE